MDLAHVDKLAKDNNGGKYLLVRQHLFDRTVEASGRETKDSHTQFVQFLTMVAQNIRVKQFSVDKGTLLLESSKNFAKLKEYKFNPQ